MDIKPDIKDLLQNFQETPNCNGSSTTYDALDRNGKMVNNNVRRVETKPRSRLSSGCSEGKTSNSTRSSSPPPQKSTLSEYIYSELRRGYQLENDEQRYTERREKFYIFLKIPKTLERFMFYGFLQCCDAFLFVFTLLPIRILLAIWLFFSRITNRVAELIKFIFTGIPPAYMSSDPSTSKSKSDIMQPAEICDLLRGGVMIGAAFAMNYVDTSVLYHNIKSQSVIKLYIIFNMMEVADKLLSSFGQDIMDTLFWTATEPINRKREHFGIIPHMFMAIGYVCCHTVLILTQATTLNVAINSQNKALLTIMLSNNFVELKGMVFKKFEKNNLFHLSCSDVRERFNYIVLLGIVIIQTLKEYDWHLDQLYYLLPACAFILVAEVFVDWFKHAFVTRFNEISYEVYQEYTTSLAYDLASSKLKSAFTDHSDLISRRMGFSPLPLAILVCRVASQALGADVVTRYNCLCFFIGYLILCSLKFLINIVLVGMACNIIEAHRANIYASKSNASEMVNPPQRQCASLPSSRHNSMNNLSASGMDKRETIPDSKSDANIVSQSYQRTNSHTRSQSIGGTEVFIKTPDAEKPMDITGEREAMQLEPSLIFSDSTVSLNSLEMNDGSKLSIPNTSLPADDMDRVSIKSDQGITYNLPEEEVDGESRDGLVFKPLATSSPQSRKVTSHHYSLLHPHQKSILRKRLGQGGYHLSREHAGRAILDQSGSQQDSAMLRRRISLQEMTNSLRLCESPTENNSISPSPDQENKPKN